MLLLSADNIERLVPFDQLVGELEAAFRDVSAGKVLVPQRLKIPIGDSGYFAVMPAYMPRHHIVATKLNALVPANPAHGRPLITGVVVVVDVATGVPIAVMDSGMITALRTAAGSALATRLLARSDADVLSVFGAGRQARAHVLALLDTMKLREVRICSRRPGSADSLAKEIIEARGVRVLVMATAEDAVRGASLVVTATSAVEPVIEGVWLEPGTHICAIGAHLPTKRELDSCAMARAAVLAVDTREGCLAEAGDLIIPIDEGRVAREQVVELGELLLGNRAGRRTAEDITVYKSVGMAAMDAAAAWVALENGRKHGIGLEIVLHQ